MRRNIHPKKVIVHCVRVCNSPNGMNSFLITFISVGYLNQTSIGLMQVKKEKAVRGDKIGQKSNFMTLFSFYSLQGAIK